MNESSSTSQLLECKALTEQLINVIDELDAYVGDNELWDNAIIDDLNVKRDHLITELQRVLPSPLPDSLQDMVLSLQYRIKQSLDHLKASQSETREAVLKLQNFRKIKEAYHAL